MTRDLNTKHAYRTPATASRVRNAEDGSGGVEVVINTADLDRHKTIIEPGGAVLDNYEANSIVLANHDLNQVVGTSEVRREGSKIVARMKQWGTDATAQTWKDRIERGIVKAASIGFRVLEYVEEQSEKLGKYYRITKWELVEWSWVSVPSNPKALARGIQPLTLKNADRKRLPAEIRFTDDQLDRLLRGDVGKSTGGGSRQRTRREVTLEGAEALRAMHGGAPELPEVRHPAPSARYHDLPEVTHEARRKRAFRNVTGRHVTDGPPVKLPRSRNRM